MSCFVSLTRRWGKWARGKRRGFSPWAAALHRSRTRVPRILSFSWVLFLSEVLFPLLFPTFSEIGLHCQISDRVGIGALNSNIRDRDALGTHKTLSDVNKNGGKYKKMGCLISKKSRMSDLRSDRKIGLNPWYLDCRRTRDEGNHVRF